MKRISPRNRQCFFPCVSVLKSNFYPSIFKTHLHIRLNTIANEFSSLSPFRNVLVLNEWKLVYPSSTWWFRFILYFFFFFQPAFPLMAEPDCNSNEHYWLIGQFSGINNFFKFHSILILCFFNQEKLVFIKQNKNFIKITKCILKFQRLFFGH